MDFTSSVVQLELLQIWKTQTPFWSRKYRKCVLVEMIIKESILHDIKTEYISYQDQDVMEDDIMYWNLNFTDDAIVVWLNGRGVPFTITDVEDFSSGLFIRYSKMICIDNNYICPYCKKPFQDEGRFIQFCRVCGESCCNKCRNRIKKCKNCSRESLNYSSSAPSNDSLTF